MKLRPQTTAATVTQAQSSIAWPALQLPEPDPRQGMTGAHVDALQAWYAGLQGALNTRLAAMSGTIDTLNAQVAALGAGANAGKKTGG